MKYTRTLLVVVVGTIALAVILGAGTVAGQSAPDCSAVSYSGDGTESNPYEVGDVDQLQCINDQGLGANYTQISDIDASETSSWNDGAGFEPIRNYPTRFSGTFDGNGYKITELTINSSENIVGLFGATNSDAEITNVALEDVNVSGNVDVGGIVGENDGTVSESYVTGNVTGDSDGIGGLIGENQGGIVKNSYATADVSGNGYVGGLIGSSYSDAIVHKSYATGDVEGSESRVGGLVGSSSGKINMSYATGSVSGFEEVGGLVGASFETVKESYATGAVSGFEEVGGLIGDNGGTIESSYATGDVSGSGVYVGGLVGINFETVEDSYATGDVSGSDHVGGLVGHNTPGGTVTESYWDLETTGQSSSDGGTGLTTSEMTGSAAESNMVGFDFTDIWEAVSGDYPVLAWELDSDGDDDDDGGSLASENPFGDSGGSPVDRGTVVDRIVEWNLDENNEIDGTEYTRGEVTNYIVEWNLAE